MLSYSFTDFPTRDDLMDDLGQLIEIKLSEDERTVFLTFSDLGMHTLGLLANCEFSDFIDELDPFGDDELVHKTVHPRGCVWTTESEDGFNRYATDESISHAIDDLIMATEEGRKVWPCIGAPFTHDELKFDNDPYECSKCGEEHVLSEEHVDYINRSMLDGDSETSLICPKCSYTYSMMSYIDNVGFEPSGTWTVVHERNELGGMHHLNNTRIFVGDLPE